MHVPASFSPEILQAVAVTGLNPLRWAPSARKLSHLIFRNSSVRLTSHLTLRVSVDVKLHHTQDVKMEHNYNYNDMEKVSPVIMAITAFMTRRSIIVGGCTFYFFKQEVRHKQCFTSGFSHLCTVQLVLGTIPPEIRSSQWSDEPHQRTQCMHRQHKNMDDRKSAQT